MTTAFSTKLVVPIAGLLVIAFAASALFAARLVARPAFASDVEPSMSSTPPPRSVRAEGRVVTYPGGEVTVGTELPGTIEVVQVEEKSRVKKGDVIAKLKSSEHRAALAEARAETHAGGVDARYWGSEAQRANRLLEKDAIARQEVDQAKHRRNSARARVWAAAMSERRTRAILQKTVIVAPIDGVVITRHVNAGETVAPGAPIVTIADLSRIRVEADVDEFDSERVTLGDDVRITVEGNSDAAWRGRVEDIPDAVLPRRLKPLNPGRPTDTRVLLVKIGFEEPVPLKLGQRVEVEIKP